MSGIKNVDGTPPKKKRTATEALSAGVERGRQHLRSAYMELMQTGIVETTRGKDRVGPPTRLEAKWDGELANQRETMRKMREEDATNRATKDRLEKERRGRNMDHSPRG